jgi:glycosyltransferase involved in cell wall biosynthesis
MARILVLSPFEPPPDGVAKHTGHLVEAWDASGHSVLIVAPGNQHDLEGAEPVGSRSKVVRILRLVPRRRTWNAIAEFKPDMVFVQFGVATVSVNYWPVRSLCKKFVAARVPVVVAYHESAREYDLLGPITRLLYRSVARVTDVPIVFSSAGRQALLDNGLFDQVVEVPLGAVGVVKITDEDVQRVRARYHVQKPLVLALGFTSSDKGTDVLLDAAPAIADSRNNDVQFLVAGSPRKRRGIFRLMGKRDERFQQQLLDQAKKTANADIAFCGFVPDQDVAALLFAAQVVAMPYRKITQSGIANLALSSRSVVVSSDLPGLRSDLGDAAKYVRAGDSVALTEQIVSLLGDESSPERARMRELSEGRAEAHSFSKVAEKILAAGIAGREIERPT